MRKALWAIALLIGTMPAAAGAADLVWYDSERQAIAVDAYANGYGGSIGIDFNSDHTAAGLIDQSLHDALLGYVTKGGLYSIVSYGWGSVTYYGWGERLGDLQPVYDFSSTVTTLYDNTPAPDGFHFFTPAWDVAGGETVIYVQPAGADGPLPVTGDMLADIHIRDGLGEWQPLGDIAPDPDPVDPLGVDVKVSPSVINSKSKGPWVTAQIVLPVPYSVDDLDLDTVVLTFDSEILSDGSTVESVSLVRQVAAAGKDGRKLIAKFSRQELTSFLEEGETVVYAYGKLYDGTPIIGETVLRLTR